MPLCHQNWPGFAQCPLLIWPRGCVARMPCRPQLCWAGCEEGVCVLRSSSFPAEHWQWLGGTGPAETGTARAEGQRSVLAVRRAGCAGLSPAPGGCWGPPCTAAGAATPGLSPLQARNSAEGRQITVEFNIPTMGLTFVLVILKHFFFSVKSD